MYLQREIEEAIWATKPDLLRYSNIHSQAEILNAAVAQFGVTVETDIAPHWSVLVYGYYDTEEGKACVSLRRKAAVVDNILSDATARILMFQVNQTSQHELIHKYQWLHRDAETHFGREYPTRGFGSYGKRQRYYAKADEIEAHAHDAAMEIRFYESSYPWETVLRSRSKQYLVPSMNDYMTVFLNDMRHPVLRRFFKRLYSWMPLVEVNHTFKDYL